MLREMRAVITAAMLSLLSAGAEGFHFYLPAKGMWCFTEEVSSARTIIHFGYKMIADLDSGEGVKIEITSPKGAVVHSDMLSKREGQFQATTSGTDGPHAFCLTGTERPVRFYLDIDLHETGTGDWTEHFDPASGRKFYHNPKTKESLWDLPKEALYASTIGVKPGKGGAGAEDKDALSSSTSKDEIEQYVSQVQAVHVLMLKVKEESDYLQKRQERFKLTTDSTSDRVFWLSLTQVVICIVLPAIQTFQLKRMFKKRKLV